MADVKSLVENKIKNNKVMVFSKTHCPFCTMAKDALKDIGVEYDVLELDGLSNGGAIQSFLLGMTKSRTVPQVFINGKHIGGGTETKNMANSGELKSLLNL